MPKEITILTEKELKREREWHGQDEEMPEYCHCGFNWPCIQVRLIATLDAARK